MGYSIRPAKRDNAKPLVGCYSTSGAGKTKSSLLLARGFVGPTGRICMIETEGGRGESYADATEYPEIGGYEVISMGGDFAPQNYSQAIAVAETSKVDALLIDSASHEWEGPGGVLDMAAKNMAGGKKGVLVWQQPKIEHQRHFMTRLMQTPIPLVIVCMRAKYPMEEVPKPGGGKEWARSKVLEPKQSEDILFEMFVHFWIDQDHNVHLTKTTSESLRSVFVEGKPITVDTGRQLAAWAGQRRDPTAGTSTGTSSGAVTQGSSGNTAALTLHTLAGEPVNFERWGDWLTAFEGAVNAVASPEEAQQLWDANSDAFMRGSQAAKGNAKASARFGEVGQLAMKKRTPAMADQEF